MPDDCYQMFDERVSLILNDCFKITQFHAIGKRCRDERVLTGAVFGFPGNGKEP
jgi:hypothetical protein